MTHLTPEKERRNAAMRDALAEITAELLTPDVIAQIEDAAAESDSGESDKPITAKVSIAFSWKAGSPVPEIEGKSSFTTKHVGLADRVVDPDQAVLKFEEAAQ